MSDKSFTTSFAVPQTPGQVFAAITNPRAWWGEGIIGETAKLGGEFTYRHGQIHLSVQKITELVPDQKLVWKITKSDLSSFPNPSEWDGTEVVFEIAPKAGKTELRITHAGLTPQVECYDDCSGGWSYYLHESLKPLIEIGRGQPDPKSKAAA
ncbi:MAG: SRPBCC domain-containing protein [Alphaproteobacteria bacterium]|nr:SRPBCC domain-containing protein [Alphaproteobacteria bacterium]